MQSSTTVTQVDAIREMAQIGFGRASHLLYDLVKQRVHFERPEVVLGALHGQSVLAEDGLEIAVKMTFSKECLRGSAFMGLSQSHARDLVALLVNDLDVEADELSSMWHSALVEVGNITLSGVAGTVAKIVGERFYFGMPSILRLSRGMDDLLELAPDTTTMAHMGWYLENTGIRGHVILVLNKETTQALSVNG